MTKILALAALASAMTFAALPAAAQTYFEVGGGVSLAGNADSTVDLDDGEGPFSGDLDLDSGYLVFGSAGMTPRPNVRIAAEMAYSSNGMGDIEGQDLDLNQIAIMGNVFYDFMPASQVSPYVGVGAGFGRTFIELEDEGSTNDTGLAWQLRAGATIRASDTMVWDIGYRYLNLADFEAQEDGVSLEIAGDIHAITASLRFGG